MKKTQDFTEGKIFAPLIRFALPVLLALFLQTMYGACDLLLVGQFGGVRRDVFVSAVSAGSQIMQTLTLMITGLAFTWGRRALQLLWYLHRRPAYGSHWPLSEGGNGLLPFL